MVFWAYRGVGDGCAMGASRTPAGGATPTQAAGWSLELGWHASRVFAGHPNGTTSCQLQGCQLGCKLAALGQHGQSCRPGSQVGLQRPPRLT